MRATEPAADKWEDDIAAFEAADRESPPAAGGVLFVGSSSIRKCDLATWFPDLAAINRGFGGSQIADVNRYPERIVVPYRPRAIVFYAGDNDINAKRSPEQVAADFKVFVAMVQGSLPDTEIHFIAIKPSLKRWEQFADDGLLLNDTGYRLWTGIVAEALDVPSTLGSPSL